MRELVVLGTASQVPTKHRNHNGYLLLWDGHGILFDPGEGTQRQMVRAGVSATQISAIAITHFHGDHCLGLAGIIQRISLDEVPHVVKVLYPASGQKFFERLRRASIFRDKSKLEPVPIPRPGVVMQAKNFAVSAGELEHGVPCLGYRLEEPGGRTMLPDRLAEAGVSGPRVGELIRKGSVEVDGTTVQLADVSVNRPGQVVSFVMDTRFCDGAIQLAAGSDLLIAESTYLNSEASEASARGHMTAADAGRLAREAGARKLVLTHFSQRHPSTKPFVAEASAEFSGEIVAVRDGDRVAVPPRRSPVAQER